MTLGPWHILKAFDTFYQTILRRGHSHCPTGLVCLCPFTWKKKSVRNVLPFEFIFLQFCYWTLFIYFTCIISVYVYCLCFALLFPCTVFFLLISKMSLNVSYCLWLFKLFFISLVTQNCALACLPYWILNTLKLMSYWPVCFQGLIRCLTPVEFQKCLMKKWVNYWISYSFALIVLFAVNYI